MYTCATSDELDSPEILGHSFQEGMVGESWLHPELGEELGE